jgi:phage tail sheath protein FI
MVSVSYPGVYVQEVPSGVHTITGVATSIAAFFGRTQKGPMNRAVRILSLSDFNRAYGGPHPHSDLAQSVRQFFDNGGADCYVVRLADDTAERADITLQNLGDENVLRAVAKSEGAWGNGIRLEIDYDTTNPDDTFNLRVLDEEEGVIVSEESFVNLSMNPDAPRFAPTLVTQSSALIELDLHPDMEDPAVPGSHIRDIANTPAGFSQGRRPFPSDSLVNASVETVRDDIVALLAANCCFQINVNGTGFQDVDLSTLDLSGAASIDDIGDATSIAALMADAINLQLYGVTVACQWDPIQWDGADVVRVVLRITSATEPYTEVQIRRTRENDLAGPMMLGIGQGGIEVARYSNLRPVPNGIVFMGITTTAAYPAGVDLLAGLPLSAITEIDIDGTPIAINRLGLAVTTLYYQSPDGGIDGIRERLRQLARAVTDNPDLPWRGEVWGYHLAFLRIEGRFHESGSVGLTGDDVPAALASTLVANVMRYPLGPHDVSDHQDGPGQEGLDGGAPRVQDYQGDEALQTGFHALDSVDLFNLMVLPGDQGVTAGDTEQIVSQASTYCVQHRAFLLIDAPVSWTRNHRPVATANDVDDLRGLVESDHSAVFYPRVQYGDAGVRRMIGPSGMIAGLMARTDASRGVWKAPAGIEANLRGVLDLEVNLTDRENGVLNLAAVNCLRKFPNGIVNWGARTLAGREDATSEWKYIPIRRLALFLQESLYRGTKWVVFQPNDEPLWAQIRLNLNAFMMNLFRQGAFQGSTPDKAFFVKCDNETTTQDDRNRGIVNIEVGFAPLKPAEFVIIRIQQMAGELG